MKRKIVESYSIEEAFRALSKKNTKKLVESAPVNNAKKIVESANDDLTNIIKTQDVKAAADWIIKNTACVDPKMDLVEMCREYGCRAQIYDFLALDKYFRIAAPKLTKWWTIWDEDGAFGAAWNMLFVDSDNKIYGACAETQGGPFVYGLAFIPSDELDDYLAEHPVAGNYTPADVSDAAAGSRGYINRLAQKICGECEAILPDLYDEDYMLEEFANYDQDQVEDNARDFTTIAEIVPFADFISGKTAIYFLKDFAGYTAELYIGVHDGAIYGVDPGNETADYICDVSDITSYKDLSLKANFDSDDNFYDEKAVLINDFKYDNLTWAEFIQKYEI